MEDMADEILDSRMSDQDEHPLEINVEILVDESDAEHSDVVSIVAPSFSNISCTAYIISHNESVFKCIDVADEEDITIDESMHETQSNTANEKTWRGYKIVGDNLDKDVKPRYKRIDKQTNSLHFFHYYAVRDRVNLQGISDYPNPHLYTPISELPLEDLLPSSLDHEALSSNFSILVSRILVEELPYFRETFEDVVNHHIPHCYSSEMSQKSETVSHFIMLHLTSYGLNYIGTSWCHFEK